MVTDRAGPMGARPARACLRAFRACVSNPLHRLIDCSDGFGWRGPGKGVRPSRLACFPPSLGVSPVPHMPVVRARSNGVALKQKADCRLLDRLSRLWLWLLLLFHLFDNSTQTGA